MSLVSGLFEGSPDPGIVRACFRCSYRATGKVATHFNRAGSLGIMFPCVKTKLEYRIDLNSVRHFVLLWHIPNRQYEERESCWRGGDNCYVPSSKGEGREGECTEIEIPAK